EHEGNQLIAFAPVAERDRARLVLAYRLEHFAEGRVDDAIDQQEAAEEDDQHGDVHVGLVGKIDDPEQLSARYRLDTVLAMSEWRLHGKKVHHLRQGERYHGEIDPLPADRERSDDRAEPGGSQRSR